MLSHFDTIPERDRRTDRQFMYRYRVTVAVLTPDIVTLRTLTNIQAQYI